MPLVKPVLSQDGRDRTIKRKSAVGSRRLSPISPATDERQAGWLEEFPAGQRILCQEAQRCSRETRIFGSGISGRGIVMPSGRHRAVVGPHSAKVRPGGLQRPRAAGNGDS